MQAATQNIPETEIDLSRDSKEKTRPIDFDIHWESWSAAFASSVETVLAGPRPPRDEELPADRVLRAHWIRGHIPAREFLGSLLWHVAVVWILTLPVWAFLPRSAQTLAPVQIELTWYGEPKDLPPIYLPSAVIKSHTAAKTRGKAANAAPTEAAPAHQSIISIPIRITHPRQTLIQPKSPMDAPKIVPPLPNMVQWPADEAPKPKLNFATSTSAPLSRRRELKNEAAPDVANPEKNPSQMNWSSQTPVKLQPQFTVPSSTAHASERKGEQNEAAAPDVPSQGQSQDLQRVIALSSAPAPPSPTVAVPQGNLAARMAVSAAGVKDSKGDSNSSKGAANTSVSSTSESATAGTPHAGAGIGSNSLPASIFVSPGKTASDKSGGGGLSPYLAGLPRSAAPPKPADNGRADIPAPRTIPAGEPPEKILSGKEVYTLHINLPNLTSSSGSWVLNFAQLDEGQLAAAGVKADLSGPVPTQTVDPKYPQDMIDQHVHGEVVLYAIIRKNGSVDSIQLVQGLDPVLDKNAISALSQWKFQPGKRNGSPVDLEAVIYIPFEYQNLFR